MFKKSILKIILSMLFLLIYIVQSGLIANAASSAPMISAQSFILMDGDTGQVLYAYDEEGRHYPASITKLMTALLAVENLNPTDIMTFSKNAVMSIEYGSSHIGIQQGEKISVDQALHGLLLMSANEVANGLAEAVGGSIDDFGVMMTERAAELGAKDTNFVNPHGLHDENHYTTAYDMALIMKQLLHEDYFLEIMKDATFEIGPTNITNETRYLSQQHKMMNEKRDSEHFRPYVIAGKTGFTDQSGHTLVTAARQDGRTLIAVLLNANGTIMYDDTTRLLEYGFGEFQTLSLDADDFTTTIPVTDMYDVLGNATVGLMDGTDFLVETGTTQADLQLTPSLSDNLPSTVLVGDRVGTLAVDVNSRRMADLDLVVTALDMEETSSPIVETVPENSQSPDYSGTKPLYIVFLVFVVLCNMLYCRHGLVLRKQKKRRHR